MRRYLAFTLMAVLAPLSAQAQAPNQADDSKPCRDDATVLACLQEIQARVDGEEEIADEKRVRQATNQAGSSALSELLQLPTSDASGTTAKSLRDNLPRLLSELGLGSLGQSGEELTFDWKVDFLSLGSGFPARLVTTAKEAKVFEPMVEKIPEAIRSARRDTLAKQLDTFGDLEWKLSWLREGNRIGRNPRLYRQVIRAYHEDLVRLIPKPTDATRRLLELIRPGRLEPTALLADLDQPQREEVVKALNALEGELAARREAHAKALADGKFFGFAELVNNQPQMIFDVTYAGRDDLVGPEEVRASFIYEIGQANINGLRSHCARKNRTNGGEIDVACYQSYLAQAEVATKLKAAPRTSFKLEYARASRYRFELPDDGFKFELEPTETWMGTVGWGRSFDFKAKEDSKDSDSKEKAPPLTGRFDFDATYERVEGDPMKEKERLVATATVSQKLTDGTAVSLTFVYANKPEYRGEVDKELSARVGLRYKFDGAAAKDKAGNP